MLQCFPPLPWGRPLRSQDNPQHFPLERLLHVGSRHHEDWYLQELLGQTGFHEILAAWSIFTRTCLNRFCQAGKVPETIYNPGADSYTLRHQGTPPLDFFICISGFSFIWSKLLRSVEGFQPRHCPVPWALLHPSSLAHQGG